MPSLLEENEKLKEELNSYLNYVLANIFFFTFFRICN